LHLSLDLRLDLGAALRAKARRVGRAFCFCFNYKRGVKRAGLVVYRNKG
jgi:hypothetical protein